MQKDPASPGVTDFRLLSDAIEELCSARTAEEVVRIGASLAQKACHVDSISIVLASGEQFHYAPGSKPDEISQAVRSKLIVHLSEWAIEAAQTAVVPDVHRDERTRSHTNGPTFAHSLVVVPVGGHVSFGTVTYAWAQEHWPAATEVLVLEALARTTGLALVYRLSQLRHPYAGEHDSINKWLETAVDAEGLSGSEREHRVAVAELQHRVRNVLGLVRSLLRRTAETSASTEEYAQHLEARISALARTQGFASRRAAAGVDLEELVDAELIAHAARDGKVESGGPPVRLGMKAAETVALALHELATNAVKYGALAVSEGRITVTWRKETDRPDPSVRFEWIETGVPSCTPQPARRGFGLDLIERTVPYELRGGSRISFEPAGVHCVIDIPLTQDNVLADHAAVVE
ncbi:MAG: HWE histidine kinase domain-containing protein [Gammaproteobacteria bacterium]